MRFSDWLAGCTVTQLLKPITCSTEQLSAAFDFTKAEGDVIFVVNSTKGTDDNEVLTPKLVTDDATGGAYATDHATLDTILGGATAGAADKAVALVVESRSAKAFGKIKLTPAGTTPAFIAGVTVIYKKRQGVA